MIVAQQCFPSRISETTFSYQIHLIVETIGRKWDSPQFSTANWIICEHNVTRSAKNTLHRYADNLSANQKISDALKTSETRVLCKDNKKHDGKIFNRKKHDENLFIKMKRYLTTARSGARKININEKLLKSFTNIQIFFRIRLVPQFADFPRRFYFHSSCSLATNEDINQSDTQPATDNSIRVKIVTGLDERLEIFEKAFKLDQRLRCVWKIFWNN